MRSSKGSPGIIGRRSEEKSLPLINLAPLSARALLYKTCSIRSKLSPRRNRRCCFWARPALEKNSLRERSSTSVRVRIVPSSSSIARRFRQGYWKVSSSVMRKEPLPERWRRRSAVSSWRMEGRCFSTKWVTFRWSYSLNSCGFCRNRSLNG